MPHILGSLEESHFGTCDVGITEIARWPCRFVTKLLFFLPQQKGGPVVVLISQFDGKSYGRSCCPRCVEEWRWPKKYQLIKDLCTLFIKFYLNFATDSWDIVLYMSYLSRVQKKNMSTRLFKWWNGISWSAPWSLEASTWSRVETN